MGRDTLRDEHLRNTAAVVKTLPKSFRDQEKRTHSVLTLTGVHSGNEIATLTDDQNALHTPKGNELLNMDKFGGWRRPTSRHRNKFSQYAGFQNRDWKIYVK